MKKTIVVRFTDPIKEVVVEPEKKHNYLVSTT